MEIIRAFFGIDVPLMLERKLADIMEPLYARSDLPIRWSEPQNLHITLRFIKAFPKEDLSLLVDNVRRHLKNVSGFTIKLQKIELFPSPRHPKALVISFQPNEMLDTLVKQIGLGIAISRYTIDKRVFRGHITLGRFNERLPQHFSLENLPSVERLSMLVNNVIFYESRSQTSASRYLALDTIRLKS